MAGYNFELIEKEVLQYWNENKILNKIRERNKDNEKFYFLQGPPYTSGRLHMGHAWNNGLKDVILRFKRMNKFDVWDRAGYDMHGLPTARKVMAKFNLKDKDEVDTFGLDKFSNECLKFSIDSAKVMNEDLKRLGITMDFDNAYMPIDNDYIEGVWLLIKKAHEKNRLYQGKRTMTWCQDCETALAKHECEYKELKDKSIYVKFRVQKSQQDKIINDKDKDVYFVIWTTTPWTLPFNLAIMVNPDVEYDVVLYEGEYLIIAKDLVSNFFEKVLTDAKTYKVVKTLKGNELEGISYDHVWENDINDFKEIKNDRLHTILISKEYVTTQTGTGLVHCAPGCGPEDYEVGHSYGLPAYNTIDQRGYFPESMGQFKGLRAKIDDPLFIKALGSALIAKQNVKHDYAHCERCHNPVVFRTTKQWFFKIEDLKPRMIQENEKINWIPRSGQTAFKNWLENLRDNSITKQRFWGTPLPVWICSNDKCNHYDVIGSLDELKQRALDKSKIPESLHKPWIDYVKLECPKCKSKMIRSPDVLDVWLDAGAASWNSLYYPKRKDLLEKYYPADFICEAKEQVRGWFNMLMFTSLIVLDKPSFKNCYMHGMLTDVNGVKMSKSLGNVLSPYEIIEKHGADTIRYYSFQTRAGEDMNFNWDEIELKYKNLNILWNTHSYLVDNAKLFNINPFEIELNEIRDNFGLEEKYILSKLNNMIKEVTVLLNSYRIDESIKYFDEFMIELSRDYIKNTRDKINSDELKDKKTVLYVIGKSLLEFVKSFSVIAPFITEKIYLNLKNEFNLEEQSVMMASWPVADESLINNDIEGKYNLISKTITSILSGRDKIKYGIRWPIKEIVVEAFDNNSDLFTKLFDEYGDFIKLQTNVRSLRVVSVFDVLSRTIEMNYNKIGRAFGQDTGNIIVELKKLNLAELSNYFASNKIYTLKIGDKSFDLTIDLFDINLKVDEPYELCSPIDSSSRIYINKERSLILDAEGYAREIARKVQASRKKEGLQKTDLIDLVVDVSDKLLSNITQFSDIIEKRCGTNSFAFNALNNGSHEISLTFKVKDETITINYTKI